MGDRARASRYDVAVVGGGNAGIAAALSASALGARTLLLERSDVLGGNATNAWVHTFCGLYLPADAGGRAESEPIHANGGLPRRYAVGLRSAGGAGEPERAGRVWVLPIYPDVLEGYAAKCCDESAALTWQTRSKVVGAQLATGGTDSNLLVVERSSGDTRSSAEDGKVEVEASVVVDTSGDGAVAALAGADCEMAPPDELQAPSLIFRLSDVDPGELEGFARLKLSVAAAGAARSGVLPEDCGSILVRPGGALGEALVTLTLPPLPGREPALLDPVYLREMRERGRERAGQIADFLRATRPGFARSRLLGCARSLGVRETRRVMGQVVMGRKQILGGVRRDDEVAVSTWPIELWSDHRRARFSYPVGPSSVPLGALVSRSHPRLGAAGRCLSASHEALGALRVIGCALATGEAVGVAAALAADQGIALTDIAPAAVRDAIVSLSGG